MAEDLSRAFNFPDNETFLVIAPDGVDLSRHLNLPEPAMARRELSRTIQDYAAKTGGSFSEDQFTIGYTGHLYEGRGIPLILDLSARLPELNFLLMGGELDEVAGMSKVIRKRGLTNLIVTGFIPISELPRYQAMCDILISSRSLREPVSASLENALVGRTGRADSGIKPTQPLPAPAALAIARHSA